MLNGNCPLVEVNITDTNAESFADAAAQAKQKPDKQPITEATGNSLHHLYVRRFQIGFHLSTYLTFSKSLWFALA